MALNEDQVGKVRLLLASSGWNDVMAPAIAKRAQEALKLLVLHPAERRGTDKELSDDILRVRVQEAEWMLGAWLNEVKVFEQNRRLEELERQENGANPQSLAANP
jgi:hypothetical protein